MKQLKHASTSLSIVATIFFLAAVAFFSRGEDTAMGAVWLSLGSAFLCLSIVFRRKENNAEKDKKDQ